MIATAYRWLMNPYGLLDRWMLERGLTFRARLPRLGDCLITGDPQIVREITTHPALDAGRGIVALRAVLGDRSLITLDGVAHKARKRSLAPPLQDKRIETHDDYTRQVARQHLRALPCGAELSVYELARGIGLRVILQVLFGAQPDARRTELEQAAAAFLRSFSNPLVLYLKPLQVDLGSRSPWGRALRNRARLQSAIRAEIERRRGASPGSDVLSHVVSGLEEIDSEDIVTEVLSLLMFGHDTGAAALAWAFEHLYRAPEPLRRATDEARGLAADGRSPDAESSPYLHACLCESMRLAPVVVHLTRVATRDVEIAGEKLTSGACVLPSAYVAQHNPQVFPQPQRFEPERFLRRSSYPHAYFPFGLGARSCIGEPLVMRQMLQILSVALAETRLERVRESAARAVRKLALIVPEGGTRMRRIA